jgi:hypothetical protein
MSQKSPWVQSAALADGTLLDPNDTNEEYKRPRRCVTFLTTPGEMVFPQHKPPLAKYFYFYLFLAQHEASQVFHKLHSAKRVICTNFPKKKGYFFIYLQAICLIYHFFSCLEGSSVVPGPACMHS